MKPNRTVSYIDYQPVHANAFYELNMEWIEAYFEVEQQDLTVLNNPDTYIIENGGQIFMALEGDQIVGTVALLTMDESVVELGKMAVSIHHQGKGIGHGLMKRAIQYAKDNSFQSVILYSNTVLAPALNLYKKFGFKEIPLESTSLYKRSNIKMELILK